MSSIYDQDIFGPIESDLEAFRNTYIMSPELWKKFNIDDLSGIDFSKWKRLKLIEAGAFSKDLTKIPSSYGGIYIYCIEPEIVPSVGCYIMYIGKATKTANENLQVRVRSYNKELGQNYERDRLHRLFLKWGEYVYVHYLAVDASGEIITALEDRLIGAFGKPPCNAEVRVQSVKKAVRAFT